MFPLLVSGFTGISFTLVSLFLHFFCLSWGHLIKPESWEALLFWSKGKLDYERKLDYESWGKFGLWESGEVSPAMLHSPYSA